MAQADRDRYAHDLERLHWGLFMKAKIDSGGFEKRLGPDSKRAVMTRLGVDLILSDTTALFKLLMAKGILTQDEVDKALADGMRDSVTRLEEQLAAEVGHPVDLERIA